MNTPESNSLPNPEQKEPDPFDTFVEFLKNQDDPLAYEILFQSRLAVEYVGKGTLLTALEEAGILPETNFGNPFNMYDQPEEYQQWFEKHPDEEAQFHAAMAEQEKALRYLYLGTVIGDRFGKSMYPKHNYLIPRQRKKRS